ncbi:MAG: phosphatase PAP2 family protein [Bacteroidales bacterium]|nr:phosphatase PAP2 family protein [Bacteroidales bacterium]
MLTGDCGAFLEGLHNIDQDVTAAINSLHVPATDTFWCTLSNKFIWIPMYLIIIGFFFWKLGWKKALFVLLACSLTFAFCDQLATFIQFIVRRERPDVDVEMTQRGLNYLEPVYKKYIYGFFSAHAANAIGFAVCSYMGFKNNQSLNCRPYGWFIFIWAILVGISRIFVGKHFLGDVLTGFAVGLLAGWIFSLLARWAIRKVDTKRQAI